MRTFRYVLAVALQTAVGSAQTLPVAALRVERSAEESCPDASALRAEVDRRLGREAFADDAARSIVVEYRPTRGGQRRARIAVREGTAPETRRELSQLGPGCESLGEAVALAVALVIDPDEALRPPQRSSAAPVVCLDAPALVCATCPACPPAAPPPPPPPPPPPARRVRPAPWLGLSGGLVVGVVPGVAPSVGFALVAPLSARWSLDVGASFVPSTPSGDGAASVGRTVARVAACVDAGPSWARLGGCAGPLVGVAHLAALALQPASAGDRPWLGAAVEAHARWLPGDRWVFSAQARAVVPVLSWAPRVEAAASPSFTPSPVAFEADLTVGARLW